MTAPTFPETVAARTPCCDRAVTPFHFMRHAQEQYARTCPACRKRWRVMVKPVGHVADGAFAHTAEWNEEVA